MKIARLLDAPFEHQAPVPLVKFAHIGLGAVVVWRALTISFPGMWYWDAPEKTWLLLGCLLYGITGLLLALRKGGPWPLLMMAVINVPLSQAFGAMNLGPQMMQAFALALLCSGPPEEKVRPSWWLPDLNAAGRLHLARWSLFLCIAVNHFSAAMFHLVDDFWLTGQTVHSLMSNTYLFKGGALVQSMLLKWPGWMPGVMHLMSWVGLFLQIIWQVGMVPMALSRNRWAVAYAKWYGWFFVVFSFGLNISVLPLVEVVAWTWLFGPALAKSWKGWAGELPVRRLGGTSAARVALAGWRWAAVFYALLHVFPNSRKGITNPELWNVTRYVGLWAPNVFNENDLKMGDYWLTFERQDGAEESQMLPFHDRKGRRGWWLNSDLLYYGNSLGQRRGVLYSSPYEYLGNPDAGGKAVLKLLQFDQRISGAPGTTVYNVQLNGCKASRIALEPTQRFRVSRKPFLVITLIDGKVTDVQTGSEKMEALKSFLMGKELSSVFSPAVAGAPNK